MDTWEEWGHEKAECFKELRVVPGLPRGSSGPELPYLPIFQDRMEMQSLVENLILNY